MNTIASRVRANAHKSFEENFDLPIFLEFIEREIAQRGEVTVGIVRSYNFEGTSNYLKAKESCCLTDRLYPTFAKNYECYIWNTNVQIPFQFVEDVERELRLQGLRTSQRGACGDDIYNVIQVTL